MFYKVLLKIILLVSCFILFYVVQISKETPSNAYQNKHFLVPNFKPTVINSSLLENYDNHTVNSIDKYFNIWCIFTKVKSKTSSLRFKFKRLITSILSQSSTKLSFHIIVDQKSQYYAKLIFENMKNSSTVLAKFKVSFETS